VGADVENEDAMQGMSGVLAIIPARTGSKEIPSKNFKALVGRSPLERAARCCFDVGIYPSNILVTSDTPYLPIEVSGVTGHYAPAPLHTDTCSMLDVVLDVLNTYPGDYDQKVLLVQPTQPLREPKHLRKAIECLEWIDSVASVVEVEPAAKLYYSGFEKVAEGVERRQDARKTFACDGTVYGFRRGWFKWYKQFRGPYTHQLVIPPEETARLDTPFDWEMAELRLRNRESKRSCSCGAGCADARLALQEIQQLSKTWQATMLDLDRQEAGSSGTLLDREFAGRMPPPYGEDR
jgi:CMP-N-acetylneuraminic acid synthetase